MRRRTTTFLAREVRKEFPELAWDDVRRVRVGEDHDVVVFDEKFIFRFPRNKAYKKTLAIEMRLLHLLLKHRLPFAVPRYRYIARDKAFGGYLLIPGKKLTRAAFAKLPPAAKSRFASEIASFLTTLHHAPTKGIFEGDTREPWSLDMYRERYQKDRREVIQKAVPAKLLRRIGDFFDTTYRSITLPPTKTLIHSDLRDEHILMDQKTGTIAGVIDFGDAEMGDPAFDFTCLWDFGDSLPNEVYEKYRGPKDDMFLCRSRIHYLRWIVDELYHAIRTKDTQLQRRHIRVLEANFPVLCIVR
jgi:aminoglycoside 2''-phosphotransferase